MPTACLVYIATDIMFLVIGTCFGLWVGLVLDEILEAMCESKPME